VREAGFGLVEIMVGVVIGLLALLIVYRGLALSEGWRRTTTAGGDAQSAGMISTFLIAQDLANAGNTLADTAPDLMACPNTGNFATTWRPIPVLIVDGGADAVSDAINIFYGVNRRLVTQVDTRVTANVGDPFQVQSPLGWAVDHLFVVTNLVGPLCETARVTALAGPDASGVVTLTHSGVANIYPQPSWIVNLGPANLVRKVRYDVNADTVRVTNLLDAVPTPNPVVSNVVLLKAQYGIDTSVPPDGSIDQWVSARDAPWTADDVMNAPIAQLRSIKAVRIAMVVRSSQFERERDAEGRLDTGGAIGGFTRTLFPCNGLPGCTGELVSVTIPGTANYRYRVFEQVIPLRNQIWNPS
jgi:type IV pilus assembly protein PilW